MGTLQVVGGKAIHLPSRLVVGRGVAAGLRLADPSVSSEHAVLVFRDEAWLLRDLGSTNGTRVNGRSIDPGSRVQLAPGDRVVFGTTFTEYCLLDGGPPELFARRAFDGHEVVARAGVLSLPSWEDPVVQVAPVAVNLWVSSAEGGDASVEDGAVVRAGGEDWVVFLPTSAEETRRVDPSLRVRQLELTFLVSPDQETVVIVLHGAAEPVRMESRAHNYLLLCLAQQRIEDAALPEEEQGWMDRSELAQRLKLAPEHLNVQLFRLRQFFAEAGVVDSGNLVEARRHPSRLRIGVLRSRVEAL